MVGSKESFSFLDSDSNIPIHMGDYYQIISKGKGNVNLEHGSFKNVLYVPSLASKLLGVYQMTHRISQEIFLILNDVDIS